MAEAGGLHHSQVARIWRAHGRKPHRVRTFKLSTDPEFVEKLRDVAPFKWTAAVEDVLAKVSRANATLAALHWHGNRTRARVGHDHGDGLGPVRPPSSQAFGVTVPNFWSPSSA
ncbi:hypothetical protein [Candidatus Palauibacter sp.]|uniref:hypothetical protein n=1 Tax=Candidatus Palauibacter sp. TaxID=3101350 RepID=UPI003B5BD45C